MERSVRFFYSFRLQAVDYGGRAAFHSDKEEKRDNEVFLDEIYFTVGMPSHSN